MKTCVPRSRGVLFCVVALFLGLTAQAAMRFEQPKLPNFDERSVLLQQALRVTPAQQNAASLLKEHAPNVQVDFDELLATPALVWARDGFLTGPKGEGRAISAQTAQRVPVNDPHRAVKNFLNEYSDLFGHGAEVLTNARTNRDFVTAHNGVRTMVWQQQVDGIPVFEAVLIAHTTKQGELVNVSSRFLPDAKGAADVGMPNRAFVQAAPPISAPQAVALAAQNVGQDLQAGAVSAVDPAAVGTEKRQRFRAPALLGDSDARLVWLPMDRTQMRLCWEVLLTSRTRGEMFRVLIDAQTGEALVRHCLTDYISDATYHVFTSDSPSPYSPGCSTPCTTQPPLVARQLVTISALSSNDSPNGWINDGNNTTLGNNVDAHLDRNGDDVPDPGSRPTGSPFRVFDCPMDLTQSPITYTNAAVVQLFYWNNWMHDKLYELGFTEAAGNFQTANFGRGGLGNDAVQADAQDGSGTDNANFSTPPDGSAPRMQMFLFTGPTPDRDGDFDAEVVLHEYTHGLSNRRVGGGVGISALQSAGMGEGWSDFYGLSLLSESGDDVNGNYAAGAYASYQLGGLTQNYYFGIRRYPYTTDMTKNPLTFKDIDPVQASSHTGIPRSPIIGSTANEVHNMGEVWCVTLWEARAKLINKYGWAAGNQLILQLVTDGMNFSPVNPNFLQARDAIIQADLVDTGGANRNELWAAFAKRGMGFSATSPSSSTTAGLVEAYDLPDDLRVSPATGLTAKGPVGGPFSPVSQAYTLVNVGTNSLNWTASKSAPWLDLSSTGGTLATGASNAVTVSINATATTLPMGIYTDTVTFSNATSGVSQTRAVSLRVGQIDYFTELFDAADNDLDNMTLTFTPNGSANYYAACRQSATNFPTDPTGGTFLSLDDDTYAQVNLSGGATVSLYGNSYSTFFVGSNGYITFGSGDSSLGASLSAHFSLPRIAALFDDLYPGSSTVSWKQLADRVVVTYQNVPEYGTSNSNSFQIEMLFNGTIRVTWLGIAASYGLAGLSRGTGVPADFLESDLTGYAACSPPDNLILTPADGLAAQGYQGGPFTPASKTYTLSNSGTNLLNWSAVANQAWLGLTATNGTLAAGASTNVVVAFNSQANLLTPGSYAATATFSNIGTGFTQTRVATLTVLAIPGEIAVLDSIPPATDLQMPFGDAIVHLSRTEHITVTNSDLTHSLVVSDIALETVWGAAGSVLAEWRREGQSPAAMVNATAATQREAVAARWIGNATSTTGLAILVYADDAYHAAPQTYVDQALQSLGLSYTAYYDSDFSGFETALINNGPWDLVIFADDDWAPPSSTLDALLNHVQNGGRLIAHSWQVDGGHPLWPALGVSFVTDDTNPPDPVYWWDVAHAIFNVPETVPAFTTLVGGRYSVYGQRVAPISNAVAIAGYTLNPADNQAALIIANGGRTVFRGFLDGQNDADLDADTKPDAMELWKNLVTFNTPPRGFHLANVPTLPLTLAAGTSFTFDVIYAPTAAGSNNANVVIESNDADEPRVEVQLTGNGIPDYLWVSPTNDFVSSGQTAGPFSPAVMGYTLSNRSVSALNWVVSHTQSWVSVSAASGTLPAGASLIVTASINSAANLLPEGQYGDQLAFSNQTSGVSQQRAVSLQVTLPQPIYSFPFDTDPGWSRQGQWEFGRPTGGGGASRGYPDPTSGATGTNVFGVNLSGDYSLTVGGPWYLTMGPLNLSDWQNVSLQFKRWLNTDYQPYASATIEVSTNGVTWSTIWSNGTAEVADAVWTNLNYNIAALADRRANVYVRWGYQIADRANAYSGWNLDDVSLTGDSLDLLSVLPADGLDSQGYQGGPFTPSSKTYTLRNNGSTIVNWSASSFAAWATVTPSGGSLPPGQSTSVSVSINSNAGALGAGAYTNTVAFINATSGARRYRGLVLSVLAYPCPQPPVPINPGPADGASGVPVDVMLTWQANTGVFAVAQAPLRKQVQTMAGNHSSAEFVSASQASVKSYVASLAAARVAIFQDNDPWGSAWNQEVLAANNVSYTIYDSSQMGVVDLSPFRKVIVSSVQSATFYDRFSANRAWFENYVAAGGILDMHLASDPSAPASGRTYPGGFTVSPFAGVQDVTIVDLTNSVVTVPHAMTDAELDNWNYSAHGYFVAPPANAHEIIEVSGSGEPCTMELSFGTGQFFVTVQAVEWSGASYNYLENTIVDGLGGPCPVTYDVYLDTVNPPVALVCSNTSSTSCDPPDSLLPSRTYYWRVVSRNPSSTTSGPVWSFTTAAPATILLTGDYIQLPVDPSSGQLMGVGNSQGAKYNPAGTGGGSGVDFWVWGTPVYNYTIATGGSTFKVNGAGWASGPVVTDTSTGGLHHVVISGSPVPGLAYTRLISFSNADQIVTIADTLSNTGGVSIAQVATLDNTDPDQDYPSYGRFDTANDVVNVLRSNDLVSAAGPSSGLTIGFGSPHTNTAPDASGFSNTDPYPILASPTDPNGAVADIGINLAANYGTMSAGQTRSVTWYIVFGSSASAARNNYRNRLNATDSDSDGIPDWWVLLYFGHPTGQASDLSRAQDDADGDGTSNLQEFLAGTNPTSSISYWHIQASPTHGLPPLLVSFSENSTGSSITNRLWNFGDGGAGSGTHPSHTYMNPGTYSVGLTIFNLYGTATLVASNLITVSPLVAIWTNANVSGNWSEATSWDPVAIPEYGASVIFGTGGATAMVDNVSRTVSNITFSRSADFSVIASGGAALTINSGITVTTNFTYTMAAPVVLGGTNTWSVTSNGTLQANGPVSGTNSITKTGGGTLIFSGTNTYSGGTTVSNGTLKVTGAGLITNTASIDIANGAMLDVSGRTSGSMTLMSGQTLKGKGTVQGRLILADGSTLSPGSSVGTLTFRNDLVVSNAAALQYDLGTNSDLTAVSSNLTLGGTLNINDAGGFTIGSYTLFTYGGTLTYNGVTIGVQPNPSYAYTIDTNTAGEVRLNVRSVSTILVGAGVLQDRFGNEMPVSGVAALVVDTGTNGFVDPQPSFPMSLGATWGADDKIVGLWDLSSCGDGCLWDQTVVAYTNGITSGQTLQLYWFPSLTLASNTVGVTYYGKYTDPVGIDGSAVWKTSVGNSYVELYFLTESWGGSNPEAAGQATYLTAESLLASFAASPTNGVAPLAVTFTDTSTGTITNRFWVFGDGTTSNTTATSLSHTYGAGIYTVTLVVSGDGGVSTNTKPGYITVLTLLQAWQQQYFGCTACPQAAASADPDGDGMSNTNEFLAGTDPTNSVSAFRVIAVENIGGDIRVSFTSVSGKYYCLERCDFMGGAWKTVVDNIPGTSGIRQAIDIGGASRSIAFYRVRLNESPNPALADSDGDGIPDSWMQLYFGHPTGLESDHSRAGDDPDGDGFGNLQEYHAGTNPTDSGSAFRITSVVQEGDDIRVTWNTGGGTTNVLQAAAGDGDGGYTNAFGDLGPQINITGTGLVTTNSVDTGGATNACRYYRIRLAP